MRRKDGFSATSFEDVSARAPPVHFGRVKRTPDPQQRPWSRRIPARQWETPNVFQEEVLEQAVLVSEQLKLAQEWGRYSELLEEEKENNRWSARYGVL